MADGGIGAGNSESCDGLAALAAAGEGLLRCVEGQFGELDAHADQYRAGLLQALGSNEQLLALRRVLRWSAGPEGEVFAERAGLDSLSSLCSSAAQLATPEAARLAERIIAQLADTAPAREAFSSLAAGLEEVLATPLGPKQQQDGVEGPCHDDLEPTGNELDMQWQSQCSGEGESAGVRARGILVEGVAGGLCKALLRVKRGHLLFFSDVAGLLFCRTPAYLAFLQMQQKGPVLRCHEGLSRLLSDCLTKAGMAARPSPLAPTEQPVRPHAPAGAEWLPVQPQSALHSGAGANAEQRTPALRPEHEPDDPDPPERAQPGCFHPGSGTARQLLNLVLEAVRLGELEHLPELGSELSHAANDPEQRQGQVFRRLLVVSVLHMLGTGGPFVAESQEPGQVEAGRGASGPGGVLQSCLAWPPVLAALEACGVHPAQLLDSGIWDDDVGTEACQLLAGQGPESEEEQRGDGSTARGYLRQAVSAVLCQRGSAAAYLCAVCHEWQVVRPNVGQPGFDLDFPSKALLGSSDPTQAARLLDLVSALLPASHSILPVSSCFKEAALADRPFAITRASLGLALVLLVFHGEAPLSAGAAEAAASWPSRVRPVANSVVMQLCTPPPASLRVLSRAAYGALVCLLRCTLPALACLEEIHRIVQDQPQEPMLVSLLCAFYKEQARAEYDAMQQSRSPQHGPPSRGYPVLVFAGPKLQAFLDTVLDPRNWAGGQQAFPANAEAVLGGLNLFRYLFLRAQALAAAHGGVLGDGLFCLQPSARRHAREHWLKPVYDISRRCEAELQQQTTAAQCGHEGVLLETVVVQGVVARCLELVESSAEL